MEYKIWEGRWHSDKYDSASEEMHLQVIRPKQKSLEETYWIPDRVYWVELTLHAFILVN